MKKSTIVHFLSVVLNLIALIEGIKITSITMKHLKKKTFAEIESILVKMRDNKIKLNSTKSLIGKKDYNSHLNNPFGYRYYGEIDVGTPPQKFSMLLDAGSTDFWLVSSKCSSTTGSCDYFTKYDPSLSTTSQETNTDFSILYADGSNAQGKLGYDNIIIGNLFAQNAPVNLITEINGFYENNLDGIAGFSYVANSAVGVPGILESMFLNPDNNLDNAIAAAWFPKYHDGEMTFGGWNDERFTSPISFFPIKIQDYYFELVLHEYKIEGIDGNCGDVMIGGEGQRAIIDTGASAIFGPYHEVAKIATMLGGTEYFYTGSGIWVLNSLNAPFLPPITFKFGGCENCEGSSKEFVLTPEDYFEEYLIETQTGDQILYLFLIFGSGDYSTWGFGVPFMNKFYTIFDLGRNRVGFADIAPPNDSNFVIKESIKN